VETWRRLPKWGKWTVVGVIVIAVIGIGAAIEGGEDKAATQPASQPKPADGGSEQLSVKQFIDLAVIRDPKLVPRVCLSIEKLGRELAFVAFKRGYPHRPGPEFPSPAENFSEIASRC
jgi:hypothetical protein